MALTLLFLRMFFALLLSTAASLAHGQQIVSLAEDLDLQVPEGFDATAIRFDLRLEETDAVPSSDLMLVTVSSTFRLKFVIFPGRRGDVGFSIDRWGSSGPEGFPSELRAIRLLTDGRQANIQAYRQSNTRPDFQNALVVLTSVRNRE